MSTNKKTDEGLVIEAMPNVTYRVELADGRIVRAYLSGKMKMHRIKVLVGDRVEFVIDQQGPNNRIIRRIDKDKL